MSRPHRSEFRVRQGFTLIELLVVTAIVALLAALLMPALASAKLAAGKAGCISNLRQIGIAIHAYADDFNGNIPWGPKAGPYLNPGNFYPSTGAPTTLLSLQSGEAVALGLLLKHHLTSQPKVLICPGVDQKLNAEVELAKVGVRQAQGSYFYRHNSKTGLTDDPTEPLPLNIKLANLGTNRLGGQIRALAMDAQYLVSPDMGIFGVKPHTHHRQRIVNFLYSDGHVSTRDNRDGRYSIDLVNASGIHRSFDMILKRFEDADSAY
jgi:prepilin-type N-terminal cleavage/methylation domain-containing protein/prepilin-type processing-associated H-X9-DG protein